MIALSEVTEIIHKVLLLSDLNIDFKAAMLILSHTDELVLLQRHDQSHLDSTQF